MPWLAHFAIVFQKRTTWTCRSEQGFVALSMVGADSNKIPARLHTWWDDEAEIYVLWNKTCTHYFHHHIISTSLSVALCVLDKEAQENMKIGLIWWVLLVWLYNHFYVSIEKNTNDKTYTSSAYSFWLKNIYA